MLELEDNFSTPMARAAASAALLNKELDSLSRDSVRTRRSISDIDRPMQNMGKSSSGAGREVDKLSGRMRILADVAAILGPSLIPIGAIGIPAITGLAAQLGFAATAAGTTILAFQGVGDTLKALNAAALDPTQQNLEKAQIALEHLSPAAQGFVAQVGHMLPELRKLRDVAAEGLFPGLTLGIEQMETALPRVARLISSVSGEMGSIAAHAGKSLASDRWTPFLDFIADEAPKALGEMAVAAGNTAHAVASLWMATNPLNEDFSKWLVEATADIDRWASHLSKTQGFADFLAYVESTGPKVADAFGAIADAVIQILQAAAPLGGPVLEGVKALADVVAALADSDLGTPLFTAVAALALFNRAIAVTGSLQSKTFGGPAIAAIRGTGSSIRGLTADLMLLNRQSRLTTLPGKNFIGPLTQAQTALTRVRSSAKTLGKSAGLIGGLAVASTGAADSIGLTNTASLALMGTIAGPWGAAIGGAAGLLLDAKAAGNGFKDTMNGINAALRTTDVSLLESKLKAAKKQLDDLTHTSGVGDFFGDVSTQVFHGNLLPGGHNPIDDTKEKIKDLKKQLEFSREKAQADLLADGFVGTATGIDSASSSTEKFKNELQHLNDVLTGRASLRDFEQAVDDFAGRAEKRADILRQKREENAKFDREQAATASDLAAAKTPGAKADIQARADDQKRAHDQRIADLNEEADALKNTLDIDLQAGRDTQALLDNIARTGLAMAASLDPVKRTEFLAGVRTEYVKAAMAAGDTRKEAEKLADDVLGLSKIKGEIKIVVDASGAYRVIDLVALRLERLTRKTHRINIEAQATKNRGAVADAQGYAGGGWTGPGAKYQPAGVVHADEFVFSKEATSGNVRYLTDLHNRMRGYADGGLVQRMPQSMVAPSVPIDYDRLALAMSAVRPIYGDAHFYGDAAKREQDRLSSLDGVPRRG